MWSVFAQMDTFLNAVMPAPGPLGNSFDPGIVCCVQISYLILMSVGTMPQHFNHRFHTTQS